MKVSPLYPNTPFQPSDDSLESERFKNIANNIRGVILRYQLNPDGSDELLYVSEGVKELYELTVEESTSNAAALWEVIWKEDFGDFLRSVKASAEKWSPWEFSWRITTRSGITKYLHGRGTPTRQGEVIVWDTVTLDVSRQVKSEIKLQQTIKEEALIIESIPEGFISVKPNWKVAYWNWEVAKLTGLAKDQVIGNDIRKVLESQNQELLEQIKIAKIERRHSYTDMVIMKRLCSVSVRYSDGIVLCIIEDITDKKTLEGQMLEKLMHAQEQERNRISRTLHDGIVQQLVCLNMQVNHLEESFNSENLLTEGLHQVKDQVQNITTQVREVSHKLQSSDIGNVSLQDLCLRLYEQLSLSKEVKFDFQVQLKGTKDQISLGIKTHIYRILQELTNNILKHSFNCYSFL